jgi:hypothetical protein
VFRADAREVSLGVRRAPGAPTEEHPGLLACRNTGAMECPRGDTLHTHTPWAMTIAIPTVARRSSPTATADARIRRARARRRRRHQDRPVSLRPARAGAALVHPGAAQPDRQAPARSDRSADPAPVVARPCDEWTERVIGPLSEHQAVPPTTD